MEEKTKITLMDFYFGVVKGLTRKMKSNLPVPNTANTPLHFQQAQLAYFLFRENTKFNLLLKKRIFLSIFGIITKSGYKIFEKDGQKTEMREYLRRQFTQNGKEVEAYYNAAPYLLLS